MRINYLQPGQDRLEIVDKEVVDAELQVGALKRRIALLEEETSRSNARLKENLEKLSTIEKVSSKASFFMKYLTDTELSWPIEPN